jgi:hypothetical protein
VCRHNINKQINFFKMAVTSNVCEVDVEGLTMRSYTEIYRMDDKNSRKINVNYFYIPYHTAVIPTAMCSPEP